MTKSWIPLSDTASVHGPYGERNSRSHDVVMSSVDFVIRTRSVLQRSAAMCPAVVSGMREVNMKYLWKFESFLEDLFLSGYRSIILVIVGYLLNPIGSPPYGVRYLW